jgi:hypothetical protein
MVSNERTRLVVNPKDKNGVEIVDSARVRNGIREGVVIDTEAGAGQHITLIGVMWEGAPKVDFLASRDVEVVGEDDLCARMEKDEALFCGGGN